MQEKGGRSRHIVAALPFLASRRWTPKYPLAVAIYGETVRRFQSGSNLQYDHDAEPPDAREEAMQWLRPMTN